MKFIAYQDKKREWRWKLKGCNGRTIADSGEGYKRKAWCMRMVLKLVEEIPAAQIEVKDCK